MYAVNCILHLVRDGEQAIALIDRLDSDRTMPEMDLLILDMHLPRYDGSQVLDRLRSSEQYAQTPVIVMTGLDSSQLEEKAAKSAAALYFRKPSALDEFMQLGLMVRDLLEGRLEPGGGTRRRSGTKRPETGGDARPVPSLLNGMRKRSVGRP